MKTLYMAVIELSKIFMVFLVDAAIVFFTLPYFYSENVSPASCKVIGGICLIVTLILFNFISIGHLFGQIEDLKDKLADIKK